MGLIRGFRGLIRPSSFSISEQSASVKIGTVYQIPYTLTPSDARNKKIIWTSSNTSVATVDDDGIVTPVTEGNCTITGRTEDLGYTDGIDIETYILHTTGVIIDETVTLSPSESKQINYTILPEGASYQTLTWASSDTSVATVNSNGVVTYVGVGNCTITATTVDGFSDTCNITCKIPVTGITIDKTTISTKNGKTDQITATITPSNATIKTITWTSSNTNVATVDSNGLVTGKNDGTCTITATTVDGGFTATCQVTCINFVPVDTCFAYTGGQQTITLEPHKYCIEVWGAQGGNYSSYCGGYGGYAAGTINLVEQSTLYVYVGGQPASNTTMNKSCPGGWNGGGCAGTTCYSGTSTYAQPGGGGTDVRYNGTTLCHRFIVAGGGGGSASVNLATAAAGGGECGCSCYTAYTGKQTAAGTNGSFGQGANGCLGTGYKYHAGGGGGGWYGGGASTTHTDSYSCCRCAVGGGSAYTYTSATCGNHPNKACLGNLPLMTNAMCCPGSGTIPTPTGGTQTGWCGNGCVRIRSI